LGGWVREETQRRQTGVRKQRERTENKNGKQIFLVRFRFTHLKICDNLFSAAAWFCRIKPANIY